MHFLLILLSFGASILFGQVTTNQVCELPTPVSYLDSKWLNDPSPNNPNKIYYHYAGSLTGLKRFAEILLPNYTSEQLENICLHESWKPTLETNSIEWIQTGFDLKTAVHRQCETIDGIINTCHLTPTFGVTAKHDTSKQHVTLTDNNSFAVYVQCWEDGLKDWHAVVPLQKKLSQNSTELILKHVEALGFDTKRDIYYGKYDNCNLD